TRRELSATGARTLPPSGAAKKKARLGRAAAIRRGEVSRDRPRIRGRKPGSGFSSFCLFLCRRRLTFVFSSRDWHARFVESMCGPEAKWASDSPHALVGLKGSLDRT